MARLGGRFLLFVGDFSGVMVLKSLKLKIRPNSEQKYNSPWNIATEFDVDKNLNPSEIKPMLEDYTQERGVKMDTQWLANRLFFFTLGYPYLVSKLCKIIDEKILSTKTEQEWIEDDFNQAFNLILRNANNANFDTLVKNLEHYPELYQLVFSIIFDGEKVDYSPHDPLVNLGTLHGILARSEQGHLKIHNRIYRELVANMMISKWKTSNALTLSPVFDAVDYRGQYRLPNNGLNADRCRYHLQPIQIHY